MKGATRGPDVAGNCSFAGITFFVVEMGPFSREEYGRVATLAERLSVGGQRRVRQLLGYEAPSVTFRLELAKADLPGLRGLVGTSGTLTISGATPLAGWLLAAVPDASVTVDDTHNLAFCEATWLGG